jgi:hypothetical protein
MSITSISITVCSLWLQLPFQFFHYLFSSILFLLRLQSNLVCVFARALAFSSFIIAYNTFGASGFTVPAETASAVAFLATASAHLKT